MDIVIKDAGEVNIAKRIQAINQRLMWLLCKFEAKSSIPGATMLFKNPNTI